MIQFHSEAAASVPQVGELAQALAAGDFARSAREKEQSHQRTLEYIPD
jgi:hypothetical protein